MFDKDRFHNALALSLGYECIVKYNRITIEVEESEVPWVTLKIQGYDEIKFNASKPDNISLDLLAEMRDEIKEIADAVHQAYEESRKRLF
jgi:hypothetical protein